MTPISDDHRNTNAKQVETGAAIMCHPHITMMISGIHIIQTPRKNTKKTQIVAQADIIYLVVAAGWLLLFISQKSSRTYTTQQP